MCYNCGCGLPDDDMGVGHALIEANGKSITDETFKVIAEKWQMTPLEAKTLALQLLEGEVHDSEKEHFMEHLYEEAGPSQGMTTQQAKDEARKLLKDVLK